MKKGFFLIILAFVVVLFSYFYIHKSAPMNKDNAVIRAEGLIQAINDNKPDLIYDYLTPDIRNLIDKKGFIENFKKERSYPYLTPLYLYLENLELDEDKKTGNVECVVAARLPGEKMKFMIIYVDDNYYIDVFREIADGSFIKKFDKL